MKNTSAKKIKKSQCWPLSEKARKKEQKKQTQIKRKLLMNPLLTTAQINAIMEYK